MYNINELYLYGKQNSLKLLSNYESDFWQDYRSNFARYDRIFRRMFSSFKPFLQEEDDSTHEAFVNFTDEVYNHLLINDKKYSELYRVNVVSDTDYSLLNNYDMTEQMTRSTNGSNTLVHGAITETGSNTGSVNNSRIYGERTDTMSSTGHDEVTNDIGSRADTTANTTGAQNNTSVEKVAPFDSDTFHNSTSRDDTFGSRTDNTTFNKGAETDITETDTSVAGTNKKGAQTDTETTGTTGSNTNSIAEHTDSGTESGSENYTLTRYGNIGIQTATDIMTKHRDFWSMWEFYEYIFKQIAKDLLCV